MSRSTPVLPFRVLPVEAIKPALSGWAAIVNGQEIAHLADGSPFPDWDAQLKCQLRRAFEIRMDLFELVGLRPRDSFLEFVVIASSGGGLFRERLWQGRIPSISPATINVLFDLPSDRLAKDLALTSGVYLGGVKKTIDSLSPTLAGSRLWELHERIRLEGGAARLPIYEVSFSATFAGQRIDEAEFHVEIADDLGLELESAVTVYLNSDYPGFVGEISRGGTAAESRLWAGVLRRLISSLILRQAEIDDVSLANNTLGGTVARWTNQIWPGMSHNLIRDLTESDFSKYEAQIDAWILRVTRPGGDA
jgi:hypothetical protein